MEIRVDTDGTAVPVEAPRTPDFDVAICGAGPVGLALAALLVERGMAAGRIAVIDAKSLGQAISDPRSIALSWGSRLLLEQAGAWPLPGTAIHQIHVSRRGHLGRSLLDRSEHGIDALGYVARYGDVVDALARAVERAGVRVLRPARVTALDESEPNVTLHLDDGSRLAAAVAVQAEGGVFGEQARAQGGGARHRDYGQTAVIARVTASNPIAHRAFERFTDEGPLALLPQDGVDGHQYALVWCVRPERAQHLLALGTDDFLRELGAAFGERLGRFTRTSERAAFPLGLNAEPASSGARKGRTVAIGNAAQTLHPVAGQGLNLGLRDAAVLAQELGRTASPAALDRFADARARDRGAIVGATDALARMFADAGPWQAVFGLGLAALDAFAPARAMLAELMMFGRR